MERWGDVVKMLYRGETDELLLGTSGMYQEVCSQELLIPIRRCIIPVVSLENTIDVMLA